MWAEELKVLLRGAAGGFLFGIPLLYTLELWNLGASAKPPWLLGALAIAFGVVFLLTQTEGFRRNVNLHLAEVGMQTVEGLALGMVCAAIALFLLRRITWMTPLPELLGKLVYGGIPFAFGVALARSTLDRDRNRKRLSTEVYSPINPPPIKAAILADVDATLIGAMVIAFNIAPTQEVSLLASTFPPLWLLLIVGASLLISYTIVFAAGFTNQTERVQQFGLLQQPINETLIAYLVSLLASLIMLWFFHQLGPDDPWQTWLSDTIVLGLPASIGGAAGRIVL